MKRLAALAGLAFASLCLRAEEVRFGFGERGLDSIHHEGVELLAPGAPPLHLQSVRFYDPASGSLLPPSDAAKPVRVSFHPRRKRLTFDYPWGSLSCDFRPARDRLVLEVTLSNTSDKPLAEAAILGPRLVLPRGRANDPVPYAPRAPLYIHPGGVIGLAGAELQPQREGPAGGRALRFPGPRPPRKASHPVVDTRWFDDPGEMIPPGGSRTWEATLVFAPSNATYDGLFPDRHREKAARTPMRLKWKDRRAVATAFLANPATGWKTNPRGYLLGLGDKIDVTTEEGLKRFGEALMAYADNCIARMKRMDAQGIIVWDLEGAELPHMITYIGDPRALALVSPEMDRFADAFMKRFRDAGFRTGITIRPTEVFAQEKGLRFNQREVRDPVAVMAEKIAVARRRWGCTLFYLDSNVFGDMLLDAEQKKGLKNVPWIMPDAMLAELRRRCPGVLIIPEWSTEETYTLGAPYSSPNLGQLGTPPEVRRTWPAAFRCVAVSTSLIEDHWNSLLESVRGGDILFYPAWYDAPENALVKLLYDEARARRTKPDGRPVEIRLDDPDPLARKGALEAMARGEAPVTPELAARLGEWLKGGRDPVSNALRPFAADALAVAGTNALPPVAALLAGEAAPAWPYALRALGGIGRTDEEAETALLSFLEADDKAARAAWRLKAVETAGRVRSARAAAPLLALLERKRARDDEGLRLATVRALGRIGDRAAIPAILREWSTPYSTVAVYGIQAACDDALRAITGEASVVGRPDWQAWWEKQTGTADRSR